ncbi:YxiJ-like family protein [Paenibacillus pasadenensis]|uniref:YxiJ family protein n=1 Tax=Paenibacillus pasadenensis TaxID=217090 RepID=UPI002559FA3E|nr:YxiJ family protein [Paenibacillus pasadenensis]MCM3746390.1 YxiJ-like family protein [Paenibacillus pasadenensis]
MSNPFPYEDIAQMREDFKEDFSQADDSFSADFNDYCSVIAGTINYIMNNNAGGIPERQVNLIHRGFFERFEHYSFLQEKLIHYPFLFNEYLSHEKARNLILDYLKNQ